MISIKKLSKKYGETEVLKDVNLEFPDGSTTVIIGGSGCGKSTLLRCINRLEKPDSGTIEIDGENILDPKADVDKIRRKLGMVYQNFNLFSHLNVMENMILAPMKVLKMPKPEAIAKAEELLSLVGMENRKYFMPDQLSGGQKQRVAIARALMMDPSVMLFDEPTSALDPTMADEVEAVIRRLVERGMTSIIVTHEMRFAKNIASNVVFLAEQCVYEEGEPERIFNNPSKDLTRRFIFRSRLFEKTVTKTDIDVYSLCSEIRSFATPYGLTRRQSTGIEYVCDELLIPLLKSENEIEASVVVRLIVGENEDSYTLTLDFPFASSNPLESESIDEAGKKILLAFTKSLTCEKNSDDVWEIKAEL